MVELNECQNGMIWVKGKEGRQISMGDEKEKGEGGY